MADTIMNLEPITLPGIENKRPLVIAGPCSAETEDQVLETAKELAAQGIKKTDLTRDEFLKHAWEWTDEHGGIILKQLRKLGASCDWDRTAFTMDEKRSESVLKVFVDLYNKGLIYRGVRMVNWDPKALTALSDEEVIYKEEHGKLYYLRYKIEGEDGYAVVATTRPETIMGDTAMCINPNDPKNQHLKGKKVIVPLVGRVIPVIEDDYVDIEFGTGCLKVTPAHDVNDYMLGEKYNLPSIDIFNDNGTLSEAAGLYIGMDRFDVREQIEKDLEAAGLLEKVEAIRQARDNRQAAEAAFAFQHELAMLSGNTLLPLIFRSFYSSVLVLWERFCALHGIDTLYQTSCRLCGHIRDKDIPGAVAWIDYCTRETISGRRRIYY